MYYSSPWLAFISFSMQISMSVQLECFYVTKTPPAITRTGVTTAHVIQDTLEMKRTVLVSGDVSLIASFRRFFRFFTCSMQISMSVQLKCFHVTKTPSAITHLEITTAHVIQDTVEMVTTAMVSH